VGIALFGATDGVTDGVDELFKRADMAMYEVKAHGRNGVRFFDPVMQSALAARSALLADMRQGLQREQFVLYYQPQVDAYGHLIGAEALLRWLHPVRGLVPPGEFIGLAEENGMILPIGNWALRKVCMQLAEWATSPATDHLLLSVNVSARQFGQPEFVSTVVEAVREAGVPANRLKIELTESMLLDDVDSVIAKMHELKAQGVGFSLDDFGTGYSSLSYLKRLPLDQLKIDQSFVSDLLTSPREAAIAKAIVALGQTLGLTVIAEGVETSLQRELLQELGCRVFQGYLFGRPAPVGALDEYLSELPTAAAPLMSSDGR
jgi:EAL domain-containing protein (putative c-di-GMP-specific phosphodiesterase class I)